MIILHHNDLDGRAAAAIVLMALRDRKDDHGYETTVIEMDYNREIPYPRIHKDELVFAVDLALTPDQVNRIGKITNHFFWFDHHKTSLQNVYPNVFRGKLDTEKCGCILVWECFFRDKQPPRSLLLIDDYDRWVFNYGEETNHFRFGMETLDHSPEQEIWLKLLDIDEETQLIENIKERGKVAIAFRDNFTADYRRARGFTANFEGHLCYCLNLYNLSSQMFGDKINEFDICIGFVFDGLRYTVGLYSQKLDVSEIAKKYGGGGHPGAAGFVCKQLPFSASMAKNDVGPARDQ